MDSQIIQESYEYVTGLLKNKLDDKFQYHNLAHTELVWNSSKALAEAAQLNEDDNLALQVAAIFHDTGFIENPAHHEQISASIAEKFLQTKNVSVDCIQKVKDTILATKMDWTGEDRLSLLIRDADMSGLAQDNYLEIAEGLRKERIWQTGEEISISDWMDENIQFMELQDYHTKEGQKKFGKSKKKNLKKLKALAAQNKPLTIGNSKSAQTQLKTALRNHIDLSSIADNKANIMLSVNAIVITVGLPLLVDRAYDNPELMIPTFILAVTSVASMIFATLSTRPAKMSGYTSQETIDGKKSNLFFFGNFYRMNFEEYDEGMTKVVGDNSNLDKAITRDLFFLGKSLGIKFDRLRYCYNIFMFGVVTAVLSYLVMLLI